MSELEKIKYIAEKAAVAAVNQLIEQPLNERYDYRKTRTADAKICG